VGVEVLEFLREVGKHVTVGTMLAKESVKARLSGDQGLSFAEFSYMLLQANDFYELHARHGCELQVGGSDQWGNITAGIDLVRRRSAAPVHGLTVPLVTRADGAKFGKTAEGAVWLDPARTLPYEFHQYFLNVDDRDVERFLLQLTLVSVADVAEVMAAHEVAPEERVAQNRLADEVTTLVHGTGQTARARLAAVGLFGSEQPTLEVLEAIRGIVPESTVSAADLDGDESLVDALVVSGLCSSKGDARRTIKGGGVSVNGLRQDADVAVLPPDSALGGRFVLLQKGRRNRHLLVLA
jgi:tyrosyl-tRNA synthetase